VFVPILRAPLGGEKYFAGIIFQTLYTDISNIPVWEDIPASS
jgi:hypothetical protein